jgi:hypothetical protein
MVKVAAGKVYDANVYGANVYGANVYGGNWMTLSGQAARRRCDSAAAK